jgi:hypothetical protein
MKEYQSIWENDRTLLEEVWGKVGFGLELRESKIEHHEAGKGVFLNSRNPVLPGTLLGFYPGMIMNHQDEIPQVKSDMRPYVMREDGFWISEEKEFPKIY